MQKKLLIGGGAVLVGGILVVVAMKMPFNQKPKAAVNEAGWPVAPPPNALELNKLNAMQAEIAKLPDDAIAKEIEAIKVKVQEIGLIKTSSQEKVDLNAHPAGKEMLMRMALLRVEKAKRERKAAQADG